MDQPLQQGGGHGVVPGGGEQDGPETKGENSSHEALGLWWSELNSELWIQSYTEVIFTVIQVVK